MKVPAKPVLNPSQAPRTREVNPLGWVPLALVAWAIIFGTYEVLERTVLKGETVKVEWSVLSATVRETVGKFLYDQTRRRPLILPVTIEV